MIHAQRTRESSMGTARPIRRVAIPLLLAASLAAMGTLPANAATFQQTNLVSNLPGVAMHVDAHLVNAWGISASSTSPFWISDNGTGVSTLYNGSGQAFPPGSPLVVTIPPPAASPPGTTATPTGNVFNGSTSDFTVSANGKSGPARFIFATEDGTISGWNPTVDATHAILAVDNSASGAVYKGLAIVSTSSSSFLYATNFHSGMVDMFDATFAKVKSFTDTQLSTDCPLPGQCFAPFGIQEVAGKLIVTYALQNAERHDDVAGVGNGFVDVFDTNGTLLQRLASHGTLNSPWGIALAPTKLANISNKLLIGNFGDGHINVFDPDTGRFRGQLKDLSGHPLTIDGLWGLRFGNGANAGPTTTLFFTAGPNGEQDGLFGSLTLQDD